jgi:hypothetical protein
MACQKYAPSKGINNMCLVMLLASKKPTVT